MCSVGDDLDQLEDNFDELQEAIENIDNNLRKNNICLKGVREESEGKDLKQFIEEVFTVCLGSDSEIVVQISSAFRAGNIRGSLVRPRDIVVKLPTWQLKSKIVEAIWVQSGLEIAGSAVSVFPDLSPITLRKRKHLQFLMIVLRRKKVDYRWGFSFRLLFDYQGRRIIIRTVREAEDFLRKIGEN